MAYSSFAQFVDALDRAGELKRIAEPVDTDLLISEWANREMKSPGGGKALLFERPIIDSLDHAPSAQTSGRTWASMRPGNCPAKIITGPGQSW